MKPVMVKIDEIYVPQALRKTIDPAKVESLAENIAENGMQSPILVREDVKRYVLTSGLHRLEACKALGDTSIAVYLVQARKF